MSRKSALHFSAALFALSAGVHPALAADSAESAKSSTLDEIVVTANKRAEKIEDVPSSVLAVTADQMEQQNIRNFGDLVNIAPNLTITKASQPGNNSINMRGIGTYSISIASQPSVAVVIDDIPLALQAEAFAALVGVQQIEVLRGPQSTLFGKSADAGVISITTLDPTDHFTAHAEVMATTDHEEHLQATVSGPIGSDVKVRINVNDSDYRGNLYNNTSGNWLNGTADKSLSGKVVWQPSEDWTVTLMPHGTQTISSCCTSALTYVTPGATVSTANLPLSAAYPGIVAGPNNLRVASTADPQGNAADYGTGLKVAHDLWNGFTAQSISSFDHYDLYDRQSSDSTAYNWTLLNPKLPNLPLENGGYYHVDNFTQEFRLTSPSTGSFKYVAGAYASDQWATRWSARGIGYELQPFNNQPTPGSAAYYFYNARDNIQTYALYGQGSYDITGDLTVVGGLRLEHDHNAYRFTVSTTPGNSYTYGAPACSGQSISGLSIHTCNETNVPTGKFAIQYKVTPDLMVFTDYARGFKGEAYDLTSGSTGGGKTATGPYAGYPTSDVVAHAQPIAAEYANNYELGFKGSFFAHRMTWNTTAFYEELFNYQTSRQDPVTLLKELASVPKVTTRGIETEIAARPFAGFTLSGNGAYDLAQTDKYPGATCYANQTTALGCIGGFQDLSGSRINGAPRWSGSLNGVYDFALTDDLLGFADLTYRWQSLEYTNSILDPDSIQKFYGIANISFGATAEHYKVTLFIDNILDKHYADNRGTQSLVNENPYGGKPGPYINATNWIPARDSGRYAGIKLSVDY